jgi:hypothetical protein
VRTASRGPAGFLPAILLGSFAMTIAPTGPCRVVTWPRFAVLAALAAGPALGQTPAGGDAAPAAPVGRELLAKGTVFRALGPEVKGPTGTTVAMLVNVLVDEQGAPRAAVLDYGGFLGVGKRRIAVAWPMLRFGPQGILLALSRDQLKAFPEFRDGEDIAIATLPPEGTPEAAPATPEPTAPAPAAEPEPPAPPAAAPPVTSAPPAAVAAPSPPAEAPAAPAPEPPAAPPAAGAAPPGEGQPATPPAATRPE